MSFVFKTINFFPIQSHVFNFLATAFTYFFTFLFAHIQYVQKHILYLSPALFIHTVNNFLYKLYFINFKNIYTFTYQKTLLHTLLLLDFKIIESLQCILKWINFYAYLYQLTVNIQLHFLVRIQFHR